MWLSRDLALLNLGSIQNGWCQKLEDENRLPLATNPYVDEDINHGDDHHASDDAARGHSEPKYPDRSHSEPNPVEPQASSSDAARSGPNDWDGYRIPKRKKTAQRTQKKHKHDKGTYIQGFSDSESEVSDRKSQSEWDTSDEDAADDCEYEFQPKRQKLSKRSASEADLNQSLLDGDYDMFDPVASVSQTTDVLNNEQKLFVKKYFSKVIADDILDASVLEDCPVPDEPILLLKALDHDVVDLMQMNTAKHVKKQDAGYQSIGRRIRFALGPIFQLWKMLIKACKEKCSDTVDCNKLVCYVKQSVVCLGQAAQTMDHQRLMAVLTRIIPKNQQMLGNSGTEWRCVKEKQGTFRSFILHSSASPCNRQQNTSWGKTRTTGSIQTAPWPRARLSEALSRKASSGQRGPGTRW